MHFLGFQAVFLSRRPFWDFFFQKKNFLLQSYENQSKCLEKQRWVEILMIILVSSPKQQLRKHMRYRVPCILWKYPNKAASSEYNIPPRLLKVLEHKGKGHWSFPVSPCSLTKVASWISWECSTSSWYDLNQRDLDVLEGILKMRSSQPSPRFDDFTTYTVLNFGAPLNFYFWGSSKICLQSSLQNV